MHVMSDTHPTTIGDDVTIGHAAVVHGCTIEDRCLIGMGAILLNGAHVGVRFDRRRRHAAGRGEDGAAASLVMGSPGKVRRLLTDAEVAAIRWYADRYVRYRLDYMIDQ